MSLAKCWASKEHPTHALTHLMETRYHTGEFEIERTLYSEQVRKSATRNPRKQETNKSFRWKLVSYCFNIRMLMGEGVE